MTRQCKVSWLDSYLDYTANQESPELFHLWSGISVLGATLGRKCFVPRGYFLCYPNQYIIIVSESARCRKTTASDIAVDLFREANIFPVTMEKITCARLSQKLHETGIKLGHSSIYIYSPELGNFLGSDSYTSGLMLLVTTLYGCPSEWESGTKTQGTDTLKNVFVHILGCTTPSWLSGMPADMVEGGFSSRAIYIVQNVPRHASPDPDEPDIALRARLVSDLKEISKITGIFKRTKEAKRTFNEWYKTNFAIIDDMDLRLKAYYARKGEHVLKVAMAINASRTDSMLIDEKDIHQSLSLLDQAETLMPFAFQSVSFSDGTKHIDKVLHQIEQEGGSIPHSDLLRRNYYHMDKEQFKKLMETLMESNVVRMEFRDGKRWYILM